MNEFYRELWELNGKLEEVRQAFSKTNLGGEAVVGGFAKVLGDLELAYSKVIGLVIQQRGLPDVVPVLQVGDIKWILGIPGAQEPIEFQRLKKGKAA